MNEKKIADYLAVGRESATGLVWLKRPNSHVPAGSPAFTSIKNGYYSGKFNGKQLRANRVVWFLTTGDWPTGEVDHIDGNPLNNLPENLRDVTASINQQNRKTARGYTYEPSRGRYKASIRIPGTTTDKNLGRFKTESEARDAYLMAKVKYHPGYISDKQNSEEIDGRANR